MSEVTSTSITPSLESRTSSNKAARNSAAQPMIRSGKVLPVTAAKPVVDVTESVDKARESIEKAVASLNNFMQSLQRDLRFSIDEDLDRTVITVVDTRSGEVVRQIPDEVVLELARKLNHEGEFQLLSALG